MNTLITAILLFSGHPMEKKDMVYNMPAMYVIAAKDNNWELAKRALEIFKKHSKIEKDEDSSR